MPHQVQPHERLKTARKEAGFKSAAKAAECLGVQVTTYRTHENGQNGIPPRKAALYAELFNKTPEWILYGKENTQDLVVPILGVIEGKGNILPFAGGDGISPEVIQAPAGVGRNSGALRIAGDGLFPRYEAGDLLIYGDPTTYEYAVGKECIVVLSSGSSILRKVGQPGGDGKVMLESWNCATEGPTVKQYHPVLWVLRAYI